ncbi:MAG: hypothetical protein NTY56_03275 [Patescibacteria group bacterium]|nr:hypothetical protein [Patescibacteria group bacterium]
MGIDENDAFCLAWLSSYENKFNFYCEIEVEAYRNTFFTDLSPVVILLKNMKAKISVVITNGEAFQEMSHRQTAIVSGIVGMQNLLMLIFEGINLDSEDALDMTIEITESLQDYDLNLQSDPRLN